MTTIQPVGVQLREWRMRRRKSQLDLAMEAEISTRHLSFVETGRARPSREMLLRLSEQLGIPLRERNALLVAAGYAPIFSERRLEDEALEPARKAIDLLIQGHEPYPALAVDRHWTLAAANKAVRRLLRGIAQHLMQPPVNVLRLSLHPEGLAPRIVNLAEWRAHLLARLEQQIAVSADATLIELLRELKAYPKWQTQARHDGFHNYSAVLVPIQLASEAGTLSLFSTTTIFGTPLDVTLSELAIESFFPADAATAEMLHRMAAAEAPR